MLENQSALVQTFLGTLFTWGLTALGSLFCLLHLTSIPSRPLLDGSLGFSAGVMMAASYWSLLAPAVEMSFEEGYGSLSFLPASFGFLLGAVFVYLCDKYIPMTDMLDLSEVEGPNQLEQNGAIHKKSDDREVHLQIRPESDANVHRRVTSSNPAHEPSMTSSRSRDGVDLHRILLMILAITVHNIPEGLAVGVGFGAVGSSKGATFESARNLAIGIGIQNFPEGLAVSLPLKAAGFSTWRSFWFGQLSGLVEPVAGILGCVAVQLARPLLPYALSFAAGAMVFVVFDDIVPEAHSRGHGRLASFMVIVGFIVMMALDVGLG